MKRVFLSTDFRLLPITFNRDTCDDVIPDKPKSWNTQLQVATDIGKLFPGEVLRLGEFAFLGLDFAVNYIIGAFHRLDLSSLSRLIQM